MISGEKVKDIEVEEEILEEESLGENGMLRVCEHIVKSLNMKKVSLELALESYFRVSDNFGFISVKSFLAFLIETGLSL